ncbi:MAG TPA: DUF1376 domain-containing protein [Alphaproteobacteria bacterium]|nr:DUF1376 domain-containing protein [Alphaproteobacteria bacterium]
MSKTDIWMPVFIGDFLKDTAFLSFSEKGEYLMILMHLWNLGGYATLEEIRGLTGFTKRKFDTKWKKFERFFAENSSGFYQKRLLNELNKSKQIREKRTESANMRWNANANGYANGDANGNANAMQTACPSHTHIPTEKSLEVIVPKKLYTLSCSNPPKSESVEQYKSRVMEWGTSFMNGEQPTLYKNAYPAINVYNELTRAILWLKNNHHKRKKMFDRFFQNWCSRAQEKGGGAKSVSNVSVPKAKDLTGYGG